MNSEPLIGTRAPPTALCKKVVRGCQHESVILRTALSQGSASHAWLVLRQTSSDLSKNKYFQLCIGFFLFVAMSYSIAAYSDVQMKIEARFVVGRNSEYSDTCDPNSEDFIFDNIAAYQASGKTVLRFASFVAILQVAETLFTLALTYLSAPTFPIPDVDHMLINRQDPRDVSQWRFEQNQLLCLGNLVPDVHQYRHATAEWSTKYGVGGWREQDDEQHVFGKYFPKLVRLVQNPDGRRKPNAVLNLEMALPILSAAPQKVLGFVMPWTIKNGRLINAAQLLNMLLSAALLSRTCLLRLSSEERLAWLKVACRLELFLPYIAFLSRAYLSLKNLEVLYRGSKGANVTQQWYFSLLLLLSLPTLVAFVFPLCFVSLVTYVVGKVFSHILSKRHPGEHSNSQCQPAYSVSMFSSGMASPVCDATKLALGVSSAIYMIAALEGAKYLTPGTYLCSSSRMMLFHVHVNDFHVVEFLWILLTRLDVPFFGFAITLVVTAVLLASLTSLSLFVYRKMNDLDRCLLPHANLLPRLKSWMDPWRKYLPDFRTLVSDTSVLEQWYRYPMYDAGAMRIDNINYRTHIDHFLNGRSEHDCKYCQAFLLRSRETKMIDVLNANEKTFYTTFQHRGFPPPAFLELQEAITALRNEPKKINVQMVEHLETSIDAVVENQNTKFQSWKETLLCTARSELPNSKQALEALRLQETRNQREIKEKVKHEILAEQLAEQEEQLTDGTLLHEAAFDLDVSRVEQILSDADKCGCLRQVLLKQDRGKSALLLVVTMDLTGPWDKRAAGRIAVSLLLRAKDCQCLRDLLLPCYCHTIPKDCHHLPPFHAAAMLGRRDLAQIIANEASSSEFVSSAFSESGENIALNFFLNAVLFAPFVGKTAAHYAIDANDHAMAEFLCSLNEKYGQLEPLVDYENDEIMSLCLDGADMVKDDETGLFYPEGWFDRDGSDFFDSEDGFYVTAKN